MRGGGGCMCVCVKKEVATESEMLLELHKSVCTVNVAKTSLKIHVGHALIGITRLG